MSVAFSPERFSCFISVSRPALNIRRMTPISAMPDIKSLYGTRFRRLGPIRSPATISPATSGALIFLASKAKNFAKIKMMARYSNISKVSISVFPPKNEKNGFHDRRTDDA